MLAEIIETLFAHLEEHWVKFLTAAAFALVGWVLGKRRERRNWERREFLDRLNVSVNSIQNGTLVFRTLLEKPAEEVFLNKVATVRLREMAAKTIPGQPIIPIPAADCWFYLNAVLNEVSEKFADGLLRADAGLPVHKVWYVLCLTSEADGSVRTRKLRAMMIRRELLLSLPDEPPRFEKAHHDVRWATLKTMAQVYRDDPTRILEIEVAIPCETAHNSTGRSIPALTPAAPLSAPAPLPIPESVS